MPFSSCSLLIKHVKALTKGWPQGPSRSSAVRREGEWGNCELEEEKYTCRVPKTMVLQLYNNPHSPIQGQANAISIFSSILVVLIASVESNASLVKSAKLGMFVCVL